MGNVGFVSVSGVEIDGPKFMGLVGVNSAVSKWSPGGRMVVVVAVPLVRATGLPRGVLASVNWTVPVAVGGVIVAVSVSMVVGSAAEAGAISRAIVVVVAVLTGALLTG